MQSSVCLCIADIYHSTFDWPSSSSIATRLEEVQGTSEQEMVQRLVDHHRNIAGVRACYQHVLKVINADQPKSDVFSQGRCTTVSFTAAPSHSGGLFISLISLSDSAQTPQFHIFGMTSSVYLYQAHQQLQRLCLHS